jgi:hypothetical protein
MEKIGAICDAGLNKIGAQGRPLELYESIL